MDKKYLLMAMLQHMGYKSKLDGAELDNIVNKFKIDLSAKPDALAAQVNTLVNDNRFNEHMCQLHKAQYGPKEPMPNIRPLPRPEPQKKNEPDDEYELRIHHKYTPFNKSPFG